jgi:putative SOS response-associated peptidase YedK
MCGRFVIELSPDLVQKVFGLPEAPELPARYNVAPIHDRMPVILHPAEFGLWLDRQVREAEMLRGLFAPYPSGQLVAYRVSTLVNSPASDGVECIVPLPSSPTSS